jgi:hypothetical protein
MAITRKVLRGVQNIRTISGRVDETAIPYKAYMKLSMLEMEKYRRGKERASALEKLRTIEQRFQEIEEEKRQTLQQMEAQGVPQPAPRRVSGRQAAAPRASTGAFKIRY